MSAKITLSISSDHLALAQYRSMGFRGWRLSLQKITAFMRAQDDSFYQKSDAVVVAGPTSTTELPMLMQQGLAALQQRSKNSIKGHRLEVELGGLHSRVGLITLDTANNRRHAESDLQSFAKAWIMHSWGVDPLDHIIRYSVLASGKLLITCIPQQIVDELRCLCAAEQLTFIACKPALTRHLDQWLAEHQSTSFTPDRASDQESFDVLVLTEPTLLSQHGPIVQFVVLSGGVIQSVSRMWFNPGASQSLHGEVVKIIERLRAHHRHRGEPRVKMYEWPRVDTPDSVPLKQ